MAVMRSRRTKDGFVYVISATNGYAKVGSGSNPYERFCTIQSGSPLILTLDYVCKCANPVDIEVAAHEALAEWRRHREWFEVAAQTAIDALRAALIATGVRTVPAPHRSERLGAPAILRPQINEMTETG